jgi:hypothetical protein
MIIAAIVVFLLAIMAGRLCMRRALVNLSIEQKALVLDVSSRANTWFYISLVLLAIAVSLSAGRVHLQNPLLYLVYTFGVFYLIFFAATGAYLIRLSRLGLPAVYVRAARISAILLQTSLLVLLCVLIYDVSSYAHR